MLTLLGIILLSGLLIFLAYAGLALITFGDVIVSVIVIVIIVKVILKIVDKYKKEKGGS